MKNLRQCTKCGEFKDLNEFFKSSRNKKDGLAWWCKRCSYNKKNEYIIEKTCEWCNKKFITLKKGKTTARFCSHSCLGYYINTLQQTKNALQNNRKPLIKKECIWCKKIFYIPSSGFTSQNRKFCSRLCSAKDRSSNPDWVKKISIASTGRLGYWTGKKRPNMIGNKFGFKKGHIPSNKGKKGMTFLSRGGNGQITKQQQILWEALNIPKESLEYPIPTKSVKHLFECVPTCYKVDIGIPEKRLAIEVDGKTHKLKKWRFLDHRKESILNALGWKVIRFWNQEIDNDLSNVLERITRLSFPLDKSLNREYNYSIKN
jgi:very-short-patch-repair endonuclease